MNTSKSPDNLNGDSVGQDRLNRDSVDYEIAIQILAKSSVISIVTHEEWRVLKQMHLIRGEVIAKRRKMLDLQIAATEGPALQSLDAAKNRLNRDHQILRWTATDGLRNMSQPDHPPVDGFSRILDGGRDVDTRDPLALLTALCAISDSADGNLELPNARFTLGDLRSAIFVFCDLHGFLDREDRQSRFNHVLIRAFRDLSHRFRNAIVPSAVVLVSPWSVVPTELEKDIQVVDYPLPSEQELKARFTAKKQEILDTYGRDAIDLLPEDEDRLINALRGLTYDEFDNVIGRALANNERLQKEDISEGLKQKKQIIEKDGTLEYFQSVAGLEDVGGLDVLRKWLKRRRRAFDGGKLTYKGLDITLPAPKGILMIGVPGCGKSLVAKAVGKEWEVPLLRLDVARIFQSKLGESEANMRRATRIAESIAPCVLWLDEVEKAFPKTSGSGDSGTSLRVMNIFLTWLQERVKPVFVVATANDIQQIPVELTRKGRFDEIFSVGLPNSEDRKSILDIHVRRWFGWGIQELTDLEELLVRSRFLTGAEIEECVKTAVDMFDAYINDQTAPQVRAILENPIANAIANAMDDLTPLSMRQVDGKFVLGEILQRADSIAKRASRVFEKMPDAHDLRELLARQA